MTPSSLLYAFAVIALLLMNGCVMSEQPLSARQDARPDTQLIGTWRPSKEVNSKKDFRLSYDQQGLGHLTEKADNDGWKPAPSAPTFFVTHTSKASYVNALVPDNRDQPDKTRHYQFYKYEVSGGGKTLHLWTTELLPFQRAIRAAKLKGVIDGANEKMPEAEKIVSLQDSSGNILRFLESLPPDEAFADQDTYQKVD